MNVKTDLPRGGAAHGGSALSESDSFINEVTEEVRRDQLYGYLRRYGWIAVLCVLVLVGGAAWNEYNKAQTRNAAQATGDALLNALEADDPAARAAALADVPANGQSVVVTAMMTSGAHIDAEDFEAAAAVLNDLAANGDVDPIYRDLASFKAAILPTGDKGARRDSLTALAQPGAPFALLAKEQLAFLDIEDGNVDAAIAAFREIEQDAGVSRGLRERVQTMMVALGVDIEDIAANQ